MAIISSELSLDLIYLKKGIILDSARSIIGQSHQKLRSVVLNQYQHKILIEDGCRY